MKKSFALFLMVCIAFFLSGCNFISSSVESIEILEEDIPSEININDFSLEDIKITVTKSNGEVVKIELKDSMLSEEDREKLKEIGEHTVSVTYSGKTTTFTIRLIGGEVGETYTVKFFDYDGNIILTLEVLAGSSVSAPSIKEVEGYIFIGWDKDYSNIYSDIEIHPVFEQVDVNDELASVRQEYVYLLNAMVNGYFSEYKEIEKELASVIQSIIDSETEEAINEITNAFREKLFEIQEKDELIFIDLQVLAGWQSVKIHLNMNDGSSKQRNMYELDANISVSTGYYITSITNDVNSFYFSALCDGKTVKTITQENTERGYYLSVGDANSEGLYLFEGTGGVDVPINPEELKKMFIEDINRRIIDMGFSGIDEFEALKEEYINKIQECDDSNLLNDIFNEFHIKLDETYEKVNQNIDTYKEALKKELLEYVKGYEDAFNGELDNFINGLVDYINTIEDYVNYKKELYYKIDDRLMDQEGYYEKVKNELIDYINDYVNKNSDLEYIHEFKDDYLKRIEDLVDNDIRYLRELKDRFIYDYEEYVYILNNFDEVRDRYLSMIKDMTDKLKEVEAVLELYKKYAPLIQNSQTIEEINMHYNAFNIEFNEIIANDDVYIILHREETIMSMQNYRDAYSSVEGISEIFDKYYQLIMNSNNIEEINKYYNEFMNEVGGGCITDFDGLLKEYLSRLKKVQEEYSDNPQVQELCARFFEIFQKATETYELDEFYNKFVYELEVILRENTDFNVDGFIAEMEYKWNELLNSFSLTDEEYVIYNLYYNALLETSNYEEAQAVLNEFYRFIDEIYNNYGEVVQPDFSPDRYEQEMKALWSSIECNFSIPEEYHVRYNELYNMISLSKSSEEADRIMEEFHILVEEVHAYIENMGDVELSVKACYLNQYDIFISIGSDFEEAINNSIQNLFITIEYSNGTVEKMQVDRSMLIGEVIDTSYEGTYPFILEMTVLDYIFSVEIKIEVVKNENNSIYGKYEFNYNGNSCYFELCEGGVINIIEGDSVQTYEYKLFGTVLELTQHGVAFLYQLDIESKIVLNYQCEGDVIKCLYYDDEIMDIVFEIYNVRNENGEYITKMTQTVNYGDVIQKVESFIYTSYDEEKQSFYTGIFGREMMFDLNGNLIK